jgi:hypothetical protein
MANTNIITATTAYRMAIKAIAAKTAIAEIDKENFKVLYRNHKWYGKTIGQDFANHPSKGAYTTALKFKAVLSLVQTGYLWLEIPAQRAAAMGLDCPGSWIFCAGDISIKEALDLVQATEAEAEDICTLWSEIGIKEDGYWVDPDIEEETLYSMPPTHTVVAWLKQ